MTAPNRWIFPDPLEADDDIVAVGADLEPATILSAYEQGIFPMPLSNIEDMSWWSPVRRGILPLDGMRVSRSLRQSARRYRVTFDTAYDEVVAGCADPSRSGAWIDDRIVTAYRRLFDLGLRALGRGVARRRACRRAVRGRDRRAVCRGVDVPPATRRLQGRLARAGRTAGRRPRGPVARRPVVDRAPGEPRRDRDTPSGLPRDAASGADRAAAAPCGGRGWPRTPAASLAS